MPAPCIASSASPHAVCAGCSRTWERKRSRMKSSDLGKVGDGDDVIADREGGDVQVAAAERDAPSCAESIEHDRCAAVAVRFLDRLERAPDSRRGEIIMFTS